MYENKPQVSYCRMKNGSIEVYRGKDEKGGKIVEKFDRVTARLKDVKLATSQYNGEEIKSWQLLLEDDKGESSIMSLSYSSGTTRGVFNSLVGGNLSKPISFSCYVKVGEKGEFNCPSLWQDNQMMRWKYNDIPKTEKIKVGSKEVIDDAKALTWMLGVIEEIKAKLAELTKVEDLIATMGGDEVIKVEPKKIQTEISTADLKTDLPF